MVGFFMKKKEEIKIKLHKGRVSYTNEYNKQILIRNVYTVRQE